MSALSSRLRPGGWFMLLALVGLPWTAYGHAGHAHGTAVGLVSGLTHPISGLDHMLAMLAVGLWGAQLGAPAVWVLPVAFPLVMAFGGFLGLLGIALPGTEIGIAASALVLGVMVLGAVRPPLQWAAALVGLFALFHGNAHGTDLPAGSDGLLFSLGFVVATGLLHGVGIGIGVVHRWPAGRSFLRASGAVVAAGGALFLWRAVT